MKNEKHYWSPTRIMLLSLILFGNPILKENTIWAESQEKQAVISAQQKSEKVTGVVKDENGEPVIGATVIQKGTSNGTITDVDGLYELTLPSDATIEVSYVGYITQTIPIRGKSLVNVNLKIDSKKPRRSSCYRLW